MARVLLVEDDPVSGRVIASVLRQAGIEPTLCVSGAEALLALEGLDADAVCLDVLLPDASGESILAELRQRWPDLPVIMLSAQDSIERAVEIMKLRPFDYFVKPINPERLVHSVEAAVREHDLTRRLHQLEREVQDNFRFDEIVGRSPRMQAYVWTGSGTATLTLTPGGTLQTGSASFGPTTFDVTQPP